MRIYVVLKVFSSLSFKVSIGDDWQTMNKMDNSPLNTRVSPEYAYHFFWQSYKVMKSLVSLATFALSTSINTCYSVYDFCLHNIAHSGHS